MAGQQTLARPSRRLEGAALDASRCAGVRFHPAPAGAGVAFVRSDLPGAPELPCRADHLLDQPRWTSLAAAGLFVHHTEHVLSAVAGLQIDNLRIELSADRLPVLDGGSARPFVDALLEAGLQQLAAPREVFQLTRPVIVEAAAGARCIVGLPYAGFQASYVYQATQQGRELLAVAEHDGSPERFLAQICDARSYYLESEAEEVRGLLNPLHTSFIQLGPSSPQQDVTEVARHKLLDFLGDLAVLGRPVRGRFLALRSGHVLHHSLARTLASGGVLERRFE